MSPNGPSPMRNSLHATASIWEAVATPSSKSLHASLIQGTKKRLTTNPGLSLQTMMTLPIVLQYCSTASMVSWDVVSAGIISTSLFLAGW